MREADFEEALELDRRLPPERQLLAASFTFAAAIRDGGAAALPAALAELEGEPPVTRFNAALVSAEVLERLDVARAVSVDLTEAAADPVRARANLLLAKFELAGGRWRESEPYWDAAIRIDPTAGRSRALCAALPFLPVPEAALRRIRGEVALWDSTRPAGSDPYQASSLLPQLRQYYLGAYSARLGEFDAAEHQAQALARLPAPQPWAAVAGALHTSLRAYIAAQRGDWADALHLLESIPIVRPPELQGIPLELNAYLHGEALFQLGREAESARWFEHGYEFSPLKALHLAPAHYRLAQIHERSGHPEEARDHYARLLNLWADPAPELRPVVDRARARLIALSPPG